MSITRLTSSPSYTLYQRSPRVGPAGAIVVSLPPFMPDFYVSPTGGNGTGSILDPWSLAYAFGMAGSAQGDGKLKPGNKVAVRGGTYSGTFFIVTNGTPANPIVFRQYPGERPTINGGVMGAGISAIDFLGSNTWLQGLEVMGTTGQGIAINNHAGLHTGNKIIHCILHDAGQGVGSFSGNSRISPECYGCIVYNNGSHANLDHGIYVQNDVTVAGIVKLWDNICFNNCAHGIQIFAQVGEFSSGFDVQGTVAFGNGKIGFSANNDILIGGSAGCSSIICSRNYIYANSAPSFDENTWGLDLGYTVGNQNIDVLAELNYIVGGFHLRDWSSATVRNNIHYDYAGPLVGIQGALGGYAWTADAFYGDATNLDWVYPSPLGPKYNFADWKTQTGLNPGSFSGLTPPDAVFIRPSMYEAGRANIIIYNWSGAANVAVDLSTVLSVGQVYNVYNAQDFFNAPIAGGVYSGGPVSLPMAGISAPAPLARGHAGPVTGPTFQVFIVRLQGA